MALGRSSTAERASSTSKTRVPAAMAREKEVIMKPSMRTGICRSCRATRKRMSSPAARLPCVMYQAPTPTVAATWMPATPCSMGAWRAMSVACVSWRLRCSSAARPNLAASTGSRLKALTTRMPPRPSSATSVMRASLCWISTQRGRITRWTAQERQAMKGREMQLTRASCQWKKNIPPTPTMIMMMIIRSRSEAIDMNMRMASTSCVARDMIWPVCTLSW